jgi:hypothetical protein
MDEAIALPWSAPASVASRFDVDRARRELSAAIAFVARSNASIVVANLAGLDEAAMDLQPEAARAGVVLVTEPREDAAGVDVRVRRR